MKKLWFTFISALAQYRVMFIGTSDFLFIILFSLWHKVLNTRKKNRSGLIRNRILSEVLDCILFWKTMVFSKEPNFYEKIEKKLKGKVKNLGITRW